MSESPASLPERIPYHVAIIMDGNGRWAKARGLPRHAGHRAGVENLRRILRASAEFGIRVLTVYAFSTENWGRPADEVRGLLNILRTVIDREFDTLNANGVQLRHIGNLEGLSPELQQKVRDAIEKTRNNDQLILNLAFNYGGRDEIIRAMRRIVRDGIPPEQIDETLFNFYLDTAGVPDPDLIIRTGGEMRISNFLVWQSVYAEYYTTPKFWPDFDEEELLQAIRHYNQRERRFGLVINP
ncbi:MAG: isoprenyl transferase [Candidatus Thermofonsia Clade 1 bacterium]|jgi:undecaprenyl diphosphate synthase|uniref:Isoprenyl transferase n=1 Tax=Candidatus Thermofonsia Clade 1 bacterium TaxID=2364210 RepID=A0A2M8PHR0_9CHLR|nr:MAG: isoprenyl transferase [Candidatus Thermofonsia Clade 1 bacterium]RMF50462.1 MAG: isoprenyl transferase [Chloroflexota bacterium]